MSGGVTVEKGKKEKIPAVILILWIHTRGFFVFFCFGHCLWLLSNFDFIL